MDLPEWDVPCTLRPISIQSLYLVPSDKIDIATERGFLRVEKPLLLSALSLCRFTQEPDAPMIASHYFDEPDPPGAGADWHIASIPELAVRFGPQAAPLPPARPLQTARPEDPAVSLRASVKTILTMTKRIPAAVRKAMSTCKKRRKAELEAGGGTPLESPAPETNPPRLRIGGRHTLISVCVLGAALLFCLTAGLCQVRQERALWTQFCQYVDDRDYGNAYMLYSQHDFGAEARRYLSSRLDALVIQYANDDISAEELSAAMRALSNFPSLQHDLELARLTAAKLELSKNAYVQGKSESDPYVKLDLWRAVLDLDAANYAAVQQSVTENQAAFIAALEDGIAQYEARVRPLAQAYYEVLTYWYPQSEAAERWMDQFRTKAENPLSFYPVSVSNVTIRQRSNGYWTLYICWKNVSVKTIQEVCFSVVALDEYGEIVSSTDAGGSWSVFDARDEGPYEPGEGPALEGHAWNQVFYNPCIANVKLTAVNLLYSDGSRASYASERDLERILGSS